jgi:hypothetical protein
MSCLDVLAAAIDVILDDLILFIQSRTIDDDDSVLRESQLSRTLWVLDE